MEETETEIEIEDWFYEEVLSSYTEEEAGEVFDGFDF